jgi:hypothetical protein
MPSEYCSPDYKTVAIKEEDKVFFRQPFGHIYGIGELEGLFEELISTDKKIVTIGDKTTITIVEKGIIPNLSIVDKKEKRKRSLYVPTEFYPKIVLAENPRGHINFGLCKYIKEAIESYEPTLFIIEGEEDLLTVLFILLERNDLLVLYGQPNRGIVKVDIDKELRNKIVNTIFRDF